MWRHTAVVLVALSMVLGASPVEAQRRGRRPRAPEPSAVLQAVTALTCDFPASASGAWTNGQAGASASGESSTFTMSLGEVDSQGGTAVASGLGATTEVTVRLVGGNLHFLDIRPNGSLAVTTVFSEISRDGRLKAVHSRSDYAGAGSLAVSQHYGDCAIGK